MSLVKRFSILSLLAIPLLLLACALPCITPQKAYASDPVWLEVKSNPTDGGVFWVDGSLYEGINHVGQYERGTTVHLEAQASQFMEFDHWEIAETGFHWSYQTSTDFELKEDSITLIAVFIPIMCTLHVEVSGNGEVWDGSSWVTLIDTIAPMGSNYIGIDVKAGTGSRFAGWSDGAGKTAPYYPVIMGNTNLTANFEPIPYYTLKLDVNDSSMGQISYYSATGGYEGDYIKLEAQAYTDYYFCGWTDGNSGWPVSGYEAYEFNIYGDTYLIANFDSIYAERTIYTWPGEGSGWMPDYTVTTGHDFALPECTFDPPEGKEFYEWDVGPVGKVITVNSDMNITALWKDLPKYTVHIEPNGGSGWIADPDITQGTWYMLPDNPFGAPEGKEFEKWDAGYPGGWIHINGETWIYAQWKDAVPKYMVYIDPNGESDPDFEGYFSKDSYTHLETFATATPEPDSAAAEYDPW